MARKRCPNCGAPPERVCSYCGWDNRAEASKSDPQLFVSFHGEDQQAYLDRVHRTVSGTSTYLDALRAGQKVSR